jgi:hypothetical protein
VRAASPSVPISRSTRSFSSATTIPATNRVVTVVIQIATGEPGGSRTSRIVP